MLNLCNATFSYGKHNIIENMTLSFKLGTTSLLLGQNGIGKTTLLKLIAGLNFSNSGSITINDQDVKKRTAHSLKNIRYVSETPDRYAIKISSYLKLHQKAFGLDVKRISTYLSQANITLERNIKDLSTGQSKLFYLLLAFFSDAKVLLLDEPINGLDIQNQVLFYDILNEVNINKTKIILVSTHHLLDIPQSFNAITILGNKLYSPLLSLEYLEQNYIIDYAKNMPDSLKVEDLTIIQETIVNSEKMFIAHAPEDMVLANKINIQVLYLMYLMFPANLDKYFTQPLAKNTEA